MRLAVVVVALVGCVRSESVVCDNGLTCPEGTACDAVHSVCVEPEQLAVCPAAAAGDGDACPIDSDDDGICDRGVCLAKRCGDGYRRDNEECDGLDVPADANCNKLGFYFAGSVTCNDACNFDTSACTGFCGDGMVTPGVEVCDGTMTSGESCVDFGYGTGVLGCVDCGADVRACVPFGWELVDIPGGEIISIHGSADDDVFALLLQLGAQTTQGQSLARFDGASWTQISLASCGLGDNDILGSVWSPARGIAFVVGDNSTILRIEGTTCTKWMVGNGQVVDVWASSATDVWVTTYNDGVWRFDGSQWTQSLPPPSDFTDVPQLIWGSGPNDVYVASPDKGLRHFTGSWSGLITPLGMTTIQSIWGTSAGDVYIGDALSGTVLRYNGIVWSPFMQNHPLVPGGYIAQGYASNGRTYIVAGAVTSKVLVHDGTGWADLGASFAAGYAVWAMTDGRVLVSLSGQRKVAVFSRSVRVDHGASSGFSLAGEIVAVAADDAYHAANGLTHWNGAAWSVDSTVGAASDVALSPTGTVFTVGDGTGLWWRTTGGSWTSDSAISGTAVSVVADNDVWITYPFGGTVVRWTGVGVTQTVLPSADFAMLDIYAASPTNVFVVGFDQNTGGPVIRHYNGSGWSAMPVPAGVTRGLNQLYGRSASDVYAYTFNDQLIHYDGTTWTTVALPAAVGGVHDLWGTGNELFLTAENGLFHFDGTQWLPVATGTPASPWPIAGAGASILFADVISRFHQIVRLAPWQ